jgi:ankyrin repeat protein
MYGKLRIIVAILCLLLSAMAMPATAQTPPSRSEVERYDDLLAAAYEGDLEEVGRLVAGKADPEVRDGYGRTPLHLAAYGGHHEVMRLLVEAGANPDALEHDFYDIVTIAAVADDLETLRVALSLGASARNITSRYEGTALIAAAHLGHVEVVQVLIEAGAPLDHVNNLGWTAVIESIVLGDGGARHRATLQALIDAGADLDITDRDQRTPLQLATRRGYTDMVRMLEAAGAS